MNAFSCTSWPSVCLLWGNVYLGLLPTFLIGFFFDIELQELFVNFADNPLLGALFANMFLHSVGCLLALFMVSFAVQKTFLSFTRSRLFIFVFILIILGDKILL